MLRSIFVAVLCAVSLVGNATAAESVAAVGVGTTTCGQYMSFYKRNPSETDALFASWVDGFYSGMNIAALMENKPSRHLGKSDAREHLLHSYCDQHPLQDVGQAATTIYSSLPFNPSPKH